MRGFVLQRLLCMCSNERITHREIIYLLIIIIYFNSFYSVFGKEREPEAVAEPAEYSHELPLTRSYSSLLTEENLFEYCLLYDNMRPECFSKCCCSKFRFYEICSKGSKAIAGIISTGAGALQFTEVPRNLSATLLFSSAILTALDLFWFQPTLTEIEDAPTRFRDYIEDKIKPFLIPNSSQSEKQKIHKFVGSLFKEERRKRAETNSPV